MSDERQAAQWKAEAAAEAEGVEWSPEWEAAKFEEAERRFWEQLEQSEREWTEAQWSGSDE